MSQGVPSSFSITPGEKTKRSQSNPLNSALQRGKNSTPKPNLQTNTNANPTVNEKGGLDLDFVENFATSTYIFEHTSNYIHFWTGMYF